MHCFFPSYVRGYGVLMGLKVKKSMSVMCCHFLCFFSHCLILVVASFYFFIFLDLNSESDI